MSTNCTRELFEDKYRGFLFDWMKEERILISPAEPQVAGSWMEDSARGVQISDCIPPRSNRGNAGIGRRISVGP